MEEPLFSEYIHRTICQKCGASFKDAGIVPVIESPGMYIIHVTCKKCGTECMTTVTPSGNTASIEINTDMEAEEIKKFIDSGPISDLDIIALHKVTDIWKYLKGRSERS